MSHQTDIDPDKWPPSTYRNIIFFGVSAIVVVLIIIHCRHIFPAEHQVGPAEEIFMLIEQKMRDFF